MRGLRGTFGFCPALRQIPQVRKRAELRYNFTGNRMLGHWARLGLASLSDSINLHRVIVKQVRSQLALPFLPGPVGNRLGQNLPRENC
jgi:hypothetical protein